MSVDSEIVADEDNGARLDRWFKRHYPTLTHGALEKLLRTGQVRVDGARAKAGDRLEAGQAIRLPPQLKNLPAPEAPKLAPATSHRDDDRKFMESLVLHEDSSIYVLNKPSGLATQGGSGITRHLDGLLEVLQGNKRHKPRLVHRLDRDTSGVILVARTAPAAAALSEALRHRDAKKIYWALTHGVPSPRQGTIKLHLAKEGVAGADERMTGVDKDAEGAKSAVTHYSVMAVAGHQYAWVALMPVTGRTHQIRAHLQAIGTPIVGDFKYGGVEVRGKGELEDRLHLHARSLEIAHPDGGRMRATAPLHPHMLHAWKLFGFDPDSNEDAFRGLKLPKEREPVVEEPERLNRAPGRSHEKRSERPRSETRAKSQERREERGGKNRGKPPRERDREGRGGDDPRKNRGKPPIRQRREGGEEFRSDERPKRQGAGRARGAGERGEKSWGGTPRDEKPRGEKSWGGKPRDEKPRGEKNWGGKPKREDGPRGEKPGGARSSGARDGEHSGYGTAPRKGPPRREGSRSDAPRSEGRLHREDGPRGERKSFEGKPRGEKPFREKSGHGKPRGENARGGGRDKGPSRNGPPRSAPSRGGPPKSGPSRGGPSRGGKPPGKGGARSGPGKSGPRNSGPRR